LPVCGMSIVSYVNAALEYTPAEKIVILQERGAGLERKLFACSKCLFIEKERSEASFGATIVEGIEKIALLYGEAMLRQRTIMIVPCDTPLVTGEHFTTLMENAASKSADVVFTIIRSSHLARFLPHRRFRTVHLIDYGARYTIQNVTFVNGSAITFKPNHGPEHYAISLRQWDDRFLRSLVTTIDSVRKHRRRILRFPYLIYQLFIRRLLLRGHGAIIVRLLASVAHDRFTIKEIHDYIHAAFSLTIDHIESQAPEVSVDIDTPNDLRYLVGMAQRTGLNLGTTW
jgi:hypothetical protein